MKVDKVDQVALQECRQILLGQSPLLPTRAHLAALHEEHLAQKSAMAQRQLRVVAALLVKFQSLETTVDLTDVPDPHHLHFACEPGSTVVTLKFTVLTPTPAGVRH
jgi:hypothetical protein